MCQRVFSTCANSPSTERNLMTATTEEPEQASQPGTPDALGAFGASAASAARAESRVTRVSGIVDVSEGRGFLRVASYRRSPGDIPLGAAVVRQYGLRKGDLVEGTAEPARPGSGNGRRGANGNGRDANRDGANHDGGTGNKRGGNRDDANRDGATGNRRDANRDGGT